ncbi:hypothetical protein GCM10010394_12750 [Streptomyces crystallinus]|uniref:Uncharacterized protein n=1 Tax=Streptomyces crystallinus TaxID=68191 RepID=A0ABN1F8U0_9ACTN
MDTPSALLPEADVAAGHRAVRARREPVGVVAVVLPGALGMIRKKRHVLGPDRHPRPGPRGAAARGAQAESVTGNRPSVPPAAEGADRGVHRVTVRQAGGSGIRPS